jgi:hypothetical protein
MDVFEASFALTLAMPRCVAPGDAYSWLEPMISPSTALRTKSGWLAVEWLRV